MFKKILIFTTFVLIAIFSFNSCEQQNPQKEIKEETAVDTTKTLQTMIEKINGVLDRAMLEGDYETLLKYYTDDIVVSPGMNPTVRGKDALKESYEKYRKDKVKYHSFSGTIEDLWECGDKVYERGTFGMSLSYKDHPKPLAYYGSYFTIWQKVSEDSLKIKYVIWNLDFNPCE
jgi:ketosteroid isomerase-like protein